ncbi:hypothetical protein D3C76_1765140 [compost metagenome]
MEISPSRKMMVWLPLASVTISIWAASSRPCKPLARVGEMARAALLVSLPATSAPVMALPLRLLVSPPLEMRARRTCSLSRKLSPLGRLTLSS